MRRYQSVGTLKLYHLVRGKIFILIMVICGLLQDRVITKYANVYIMNGFSVFLATSCVAGKYLQFAPTIEIWNYYFLNLKHVN